MRGRALGAIVAVVAIALGAPAFAMQGGAAPDDLPGGALLDEAPVEPTVTAAVSSQEVTLGKPFVLFVTVTMNPGVEVNLPGHLELGSAFEVGSWTSSDRPGLGGTRRRDYEVMVTPWELGDLVLSPVTVSWSSGNVRSAVPTNAVAVHVLGSLGGQSDELRPLATPVPLESRDWTLVWIGIGAGALLLAGVAIVVAVALRRRARRRRRLVRRDGGSVLVPLAPADARALRALDELETSADLAAAELAPLFAAMAEIVRSYLTQRFAVQAHEMTTRELAAALAGIPAATAAARLVPPWFEVCDLVRYAKARVDRDDVRTGFEGARRIVTETAALAVAAPPRRTATVAEVSPAPPREEPADAS